MKRSLNDVKNQLSEISPTYCAAKWLQSTLWLNSGTTASCHLPPAHKIDAKKASRDPRELHSTPEKIEARAQMLRGEQPAECASCWTAERAGAQSERLVKSRAHTQADFLLTGGAPADWKVNPTHLEIAFGNKCNFACTYCNGEFSSRWQAELAAPYVNLQTDGSATYTAGRTWPPQADPVFMQAFEKWWPRLRKDLQLLRFTGGEPLLSQEFWRFLENISLTSPDFVVAVNTNLGVSRILIERLIKLAARFPHFEIYTSNEGTGDWAEYIRDGLDDLAWQENLLLCRNAGVFQRITVMATLGALSGWGLPEMIRTLRKEQAAQPAELSFNLLRFPEFQSFAALKPQARQQLATDYVKILGQSRALSFSDIETVGLERMVALLMNTSDVSPGHQRKLEEDLKSFVQQYDQRRGKASRGKTIVQAAPASLKFFLPDWAHSSTSSDTRDRAPEVFP